MYGRALVQRTARIYVYIHSGPRASERERETRASTSERVQCTLMASISVHKRLSTQSYRARAEGIERAVEFVGKGIGGGRKAV